MTEAPNFVAMKRWFAENRKDIPARHLAFIMENDAHVLLMTAAFQAGREFQMRNPEAGKFLELKEYN